METTKIPKCGVGASSIVINGKVHIFGGKDSCDHIIFDPSTNNLTTLKDKHQIKKAGYENILIYNHQIIRFGGFNTQTTKMLGRFMICDDFESTQDHQYSFINKPNYKIDKVINGCGYLIYNNYLITFGGRTDEEMIDDIYILNLNDGSTTNKWIKVNAKCPHQSGYQAILMQNEMIHLITRAGSNPTHHNIHISKILGQYYTKPQQNTDNDDIKKEYDIVEAEKQSLQSLVDELLNNQNELKQENQQLKTRNNESLTNNTQLSQEIIQLKALNKEKDGQYIQLQNEVQELTQSNQHLLTELNKIKSLLNKQQQEEKKDESVKTLKEDLIFMADKMNQFNITYDETKLNEIYNQDMNNLFVEQEIDNVELSAKSMIKNLSDIKVYVLSVTKPDISKYNEWDINRMITWIKSLDNGAYIKYEEVLRNGFETDGITGEDLPSLVPADLAVVPFEIRQYKDRKKLCQHFKSLDQQNIQCAYFDHLVLALPVTLNSVFFLIQCL